MMGALAAVTAWAAVLVLVPQRLATAASATTAPWTRRLAGVALLLALGVGVVAIAPSSRQAVLAMEIQCAAALAWFDTRYLVIPDLYVVALLVPALAGPLENPWPIWLAGAALGGGLLFAVRALWRWRTGTEGLGFGDVKLATALGALLGPEAIAQTICASALLGAAGLLLIRRRAPDGVAPLGALLAIVGVGFLAWTRWR